MSTQLNVVHFISGTNVYTSFSSSGYTVSSTSLHVIGPSPSTTQINGTVSGTTSGSGSITSITAAGTYNLNFIISRRGSSFGKFAQINILNSPSLTSISSINPRFSDYINIILVGLNGGGNNSVILNITFQNQNNFTSFTKTTPITGVAGNVSLPITTMPVGVPLKITNITLSNTRNVTNLIADVSPTSGTISISGTTGSTVNITSYPTDIFIVGLPPGQPRNVALSGNQIRFTAPISNGGITITRYQARAVAGATTIDISGATSPLTFSGLTDLSGYTVTVAAINAAGTGPFAPLSTVTSDVSNVAVSISANRQARITWTAPTSDGGADITSYRIRLSTTDNTPSATRTIDVSGTLRQLDIPNLYSAKTYNISITAVNAIGESNPVSRQLFIPLVQDARMLDQGAATSFIVANSSSIQGRILSTGSAANGVAGSGSNTTKQTFSSIHVASAQTDIANQICIGVKAVTNTTYALTNTGKIYTCGLANSTLARNTINNTSLRIASNTDVGSPIYTSIASGQGGSVIGAIRADGKFFTWGNNQLTGEATGIIGRDIGTAVEDANPGEVNLDGKYAIDAAFGAEFGLVLCSDGTVKIWGRNTNGTISTALGLTTVDIPTTTITVNPVDIDIPTATTRAIQVACGDYFGAILYSNGTCRYFGTFSTGSITGTASIAGKSLMQIACGARHIIGLANDSTVYGWGYSDGTTRLLGNTSNTVTYSQPVQINSTTLNSTTGIISVSCGQNHNTVLTRTGNVRAWGSGATFRLGNNATSVINADVQVTLPTGFTATTSLPSYPPFSPIVTFTSTLSSIRPVWTAPVTRGTPVTGYRLTCTDPSSNVLTLTLNAADLSANITQIDGAPLESLRDYTITLVAISDAGESFPSTPVIAQILGVPSVPQNCVALSGNTQITLQWQAPGRNGGGVITKYQVYPVIGGQQLAPTDLSGAATSFTITGLTNGTTYTYDVLAVNANGAGEAVRVSAVPSTVPNQPTNLVAQSPANKTLRISWTAGANGGAEITSHRVTVARTGESTRTVDTAQTTADISGLTNGAVYTIQVTSTNIKGASAATTTTGTPVPATAADAIDDIETNTTAMQVYVSAQQSAQAADRNTILLGLRNEVKAKQAAAQIQVAAVKSAKQSYIAALRSVPTGRVDILKYADSEPIFATTSAAATTRPQKPLDAVLPDFAAAQIPTIRLGTDVSSSSAEYTHFEVPPTNSITLADPSGNTVTLTNAIDTSGGYVDAAGNLYQVGSFIELPRATLLVAGLGTLVTIAVPSSPIAVSASGALDRRVTVSWQPPLNNGGEAPSTYTVQWTGTDASGIRDLSGTVFTTDINGLTNGVEYQFRVRAANSAGTGPWSAYFKATPSTLPGAPVIQSAAAVGSRQTRITWQAPASNGGAAISRYIVVASAAGYPDVSSNIFTDISGILSGLLNGIAYTYTVAAQNASGIGPQSAASSAVTTLSTTAAEAVADSSGGIVQAISTYVAAAAGQPAAIYLDFRTALKASSLGTTDKIAARAAVIDAIRAKAGTSSITVSAASSAAFFASLDASGSGLASKDIQVILPAYTAGAATLSYNDISSAGAVYCHIELPQTYTLSLTAGGTTRQLTYDGTSVRVDGVATSLGSTVDVGAKRFKLAGRGSLLTEQGYADAPGGLSVSPLVEGARVSWTASAAPAAAPVTGYQITWSGTAGSGSATVGSTTTTYDISGSLVGGARVTVSVVAINLMGTSAASSIADTFVYMEAGLRKWSIGSNSGSSAVIARDGKVYVWGSNEGSKFGIATNPIMTPTAISISNKQIIDIAIGLNHTLVLCHDGTVYSAGTSTNTTTISNAILLGRSGTNTVYGQITALPTIVSIAAGYDFSVALDDYGTVYTWGMNDRGQAGKGLTAIRSGISSVNIPKQIAYIAASQDHVMTISTDGTIYTWGASHIDANNYILCRTTSTTNPANKPGLVTKPAGEVPIMICGCMNGTAILYASGNVYVSSAYYGSTYLEQRVLQYNKKGVFLTSGNRHLAVVCSDGTLQISSIDGGALFPVTLGGIDSPYNAFQQVTFPHMDAVVVASGAWHNVYVTKAGNIFSWGTNDTYQLGNGNTNSSAAAIQVNLPGGVLANTTFSEPISPYSAYGLTAVPTMTGATIGWTASPSDGSSPIVRYTVASSPTGFQRDVSANQTTVDISGLTKGVAYTFTVTAVNAIGTSFTSAPSPTVYRFSEPGAPGVPTGTYGDRLIDLQWAAPTTNINNLADPTGGTPITLYRVRSVAFPDISGTTAGTSIRIAGLTNGTAYTFVVEALNAVGWGPASSASASITPSTVPAAPTTLTVTSVGNKSVTLGWSPFIWDTLATGGAALTGFQIDLSGTTDIVTVTPGSSSRNATVSTLTNGVTYSVTVRARNVNGLGAASTTVSVYPRPTTIAELIADASGSAGNPLAMEAFVITQLAASATAPALYLQLRQTFAGNASLLAQIPAAFATASRQFVTVPAASSTSYLATVPQLLAGQPQRDIIVYMPAAAASPITIPFTTFSVTNGSSHVAIDTQTPANITLTDGSGIAINMGGLTIGNYVNIGSYRCRVIATAPLILQAGYPFDAQISQAVPSNKKISVSWSAAANGGNSIIDYSVQVDVSGGVTPVQLFTVPAAQTAIDISGLVNGGIYTVTITARNTIGTGPAISRSSLVPYPTTAAEAVADAAAGNVAAVPLYIDNQPPATSTLDILLGLRGQVKSAGLVGSTVVKGEIVDSIRQREGAAAGTNLVLAAPAATVSQLIATYTATAPAADANKPIQIVLPSFDVSGIATVDLGSAAANQLIHYEVPPGNSITFLAGDVSGTYVFDSSGAQLAGTSRRYTAGTFITVGTQTFKLIGVGSILAEPGYPPPVTALQATPSNGTVRLTWELPAGIDPATVAYYKVQTTDGAFSVQTTGTSATFVGLTNGLTYSFTVMIRSTAGVDGPAALSDPIVPAIPPSSQERAGAAADPYVTTVSNKTYKLPTMNGAVRFYQGMVGGHELTVNVTLRCVSSEELVRDNILSFIALQEKIPRESRQAFLDALMNGGEQLCFFERVYVEYCGAELVVNLWNGRFVVEKNTSDFMGCLVEGGHLLRKHSAYYRGYEDQTLRVDIGSAKIYLAVYDCPLIRNGVYVEAPAMQEGNGVVVNVLSSTDMTLDALDDLRPVVRRDTETVMQKETFVDHDGYRVRLVAVAASATH